MQPLVAMKQGFLNDEDLHLFAHMQERLMNEVMGSTILHATVKSDAPLQAHDAFCRPSIAESSKQKEETVSPSPPRRSSFASFPRKGMEDEPPKDGKGKAEPTRPTQVEKLVEPKSTGELKNAREAANLAKRQPEESPIISSRPSNPFAKKSNTQENSSLLNSLKKMKTETQGKR